MNIFLWILQILLALHTLPGAVWKFSNTAAQTHPSLAVIPNGVWLSFSVIEILCAIALVLPVFNKSISKLAPMAAIVIALEMLLFSILNISSGNPDFNSIIYWLVVAALCAFIAYGRLVLKPLAK